MTEANGSAGRMTAYAASMGWINWFGLILIALLMLPNILWAVRHRGAENRCQNRLMNVLEQLGRYGCMGLMVCNIGLKEFGFASQAAFVIYLLGNAVLLTLYWICWAVYAKTHARRTAVLLALLPSLLFLLSGLTLRHWLLVGFAALFCVAHTYVTIQNAKEDSNV